jgi:hypothetical protein
MWIHPALVKLRNHAGFRTPQNEIGPLSVTTALLSFDIHDSLFDIRFTTAQQNVTQIPNRLAPNSK